MHVMSQLTYFTIWHDSNVVADITWLAYKMIQIMAKNQCLKSTSFFKSRFSSKYFFPLNIIISHKQVSVQFSRSVVSNSLWPHGLQHARLPCPITNSQTLLKLMSIESVMPSNHLILSCPLCLLPSIFPSIRVFSNDSVLCFRRPKYWSFSFSISPSNEYSGLIPFRIDGLDLLAVQGTLKSSPAPQLKSINSLVLSFLYGTPLASIHDYWKKP